MSKRTVRSVSFSLYVPVDYMTETNVFCVTRFLADSGEIRITALRRRGRARHASG
jgi:hypothetical protein